MRTHHGRRWMFAGLAIVSMGAFADAPTPAAKAAFLALPKVYVKWEITETGTRQFAPATNELNDIAFNVDRHMTGVVPLNMAIPGSYPMSSMPMGIEEMTEAGRFTGWMASPPESDAAVEQVTSGHVDPATNPMFVPVDFAVNDTIRRRYRDSPSTGFATDTYTMKGSGKVYGALSGMLLCDLKKMTCDVNNVLFNFNEDKDKVTVVTTSDFPGFESRTEINAPPNYLPNLPPALTARLSALPLKLPLPSAAAFSEPAGDQNFPPGSAPGDHAPVVTLKVILSATP